MLSTDRPSGTPRRDAIHRRDTIRQLEELRRTLRIGSIVIAPILWITAVFLAARYPTHAPALIAAWLVDGLAIGILYPLAVHAPRQIIVRLTLLMASIPAVALVGTLAIEPLTLLSMTSSFAILPVAVPLFLGWSRRLRTAWLITYATILIAIIGLLGINSLLVSQRIDIIVNIIIGCLIGWFGGALLERPRQRTIANELELRRLNRILGAHAATDPLTDLLNRRRLETDLGLLAVSLRQSDAPCAVLMFDIDRFKRLNDELGHGAGDAALRRVGAELKRVVRGRDTVYRYGGEEFVVILPDVTLEAARVVAERIRLAIEGLAIQGRSGDAPATLTISGGVALSLPPHEDWDAALRVADFALYEAKAAGRNQICSAPPESMAASADESAVASRHPWRTARMLDLRPEEAL